MQRPDEERHPIVKRTDDAPGFRSCGAKKRSGKLCTQPAGFGTDHPGTGQCRYHGGATVVGNRIAAREEVEQVSKVLRLSGLRRMNPADALMEELSRAAGAVAYFDERVAQADLTSPMDILLVEMWNEQRKMYLQTAALAARAGIDERAIRIQEQSAQALVAALLAVLAKMDLAPEQIAVAKVEMATQLRALSAAS